MKIIELTRPFASHPRDAPPSLIVMHATAGANASGAIETLREKGYGYHYIVKDEDEGDGTVLKCVATDRVCYHAGNSYGPREEARGVSRVQGEGARFVAGCSVNGYSIGISFVNMDDGRDPFSPAQTQAARALVAALRAAIPTISAITTHAIVSPRRKVDPLGFDIDALGKATRLPVWRPRGG